MYGLRRLYLPNNGHQYHYIISSRPGQAKRTNSSTLHPLEPFMQKDVVKRTVLGYYLHMETTPVSAEEKATPTYKRYAKMLGLLYWEKDSSYNHEKQDYDTKFYPVMVAGLERRWNGRYRYMVQILDKAQTENRKDTYSIECTRFNRYVKIGNYALLNKNNPVPPEDKNPRGW